MVKKIGQWAFAGNNSKQQFPPLSLNCADILSGHLGEPHTRFLSALAEFLFKEAGISLWSIGKIVLNAFGKKAAIQIGKFMGLNLSQNFYFI